jgi:hypothetical protein
VRPRIIATKFLDSPGLRSHAARPEVVACQERTLSDQPSHGRTNWCHREPDRAWRSRGARIQPLPSVSALLRAAPLAMTGRLAFAFASRRSGRSDRCGSGRLGLTGRNRQRGRCERRTSRFEGKSVAFRTRSASRALPCEGSVARSRSETGGTNGALLPGKPSAH